MHGQPPTHTHLGWRAARAHHAMPRQQAGSVSGDRSRFEIMLNCRNPRVGKDTSKHSQVKVGAAMCAKAMADSKRCTWGAILDYWGAVLPYCCNDYWDAVLQYCCNDYHRKECAAMRLPETCQNNGVKKTRLLHNIQPQARVKGKVRGGRGWMGCKVSNEP